MTNRTTDLTATQLSAIAGAFACCFTWLAGTLTIFALQGGGVA